MTYTLYNGDCLEILPTLKKRNAFIVTDPPYGIRLRTEYARCKRGSLAPCNNFSPIVGDSEPFDPAHLLRFRRLILFGANHYADKLPASGAWIVWDKLDGLSSGRELGFNDNSDCELIWTNIGNAARIIRHRWMGAMKASEHNDRRIHPTQKPIELLRKIIKWYTPSDAVIIDPYMGSGATGIAALSEGRNFIGIEIDAGYFDLAKQRIEQAERQTTGEFMTIVDDGAMPTFGLFAEVAQ